MTSASFPRAINHRTIVWLAFFAALFWCVVFFMQWRYGFDPADEGLLWYVAQRTSKGETPILNWFSYDPGRYFWCAVWFRVLGDDGLLQLRIANAAFGLIGFLAAMIVIRHARIPWPVALIAGLALCVMMCFPRHKIYEQSLVLILCATGYFALNSISASRWLVLGIATGVAALIGRNSGVYFLGASLALGITSWARTQPRAWPRLSNIFLWGCGILIGYAPLLYLALTNSSFRESFVESVRTVGSWQAPLPIMWPWRVAWSGSLSTYQHQLQMLSIFCLALPLIYFCAWIISLKNAKTQSTASLAGSAGIAGLAYLHHAFDRADFAHVSQAGVAAIVAVAAICSYLIRQGKRTPYIQGVSVGALFFLLDFALWLPFGPMVAYRTSPDSYAPLEIHASRFFVPTSFNSLVNQANEALYKCSRRDGQVLVAPYGPGLYSFLGLRAPFWELYYAYPRSAEMQKAHVAAMQKWHTGVVLINREQTIDDRANLRLTKTYPLLLNFIESKYQKRAGNPGTVETWVRADYCRQAN